VHLSTCKYIPIKSLGKSKEGELEKAEFITSAEKLCAQNKPFFKPQGYR
jgi:hypothetical protein